MKIIITMKDTWDIGIDSTHILEDRIEKLLKKKFNIKSATFKTGYSRVTFQIKEPQKKKKSRR